MTHNDFTYTELLKESYELTKKHFLFLLGLLAIGILIAAITSKIPFISQIVSVALSIAGTYIFLMIAKGHTPKYKDALHPFKNYLIAWHYFIALLLMVLLFILTGLILLVGYVVSLLTLSVTAFGVASIVFLAAIIYFGIRLNFFRYIIVENEKVGAIEALKKSIHMTEGRFWKIVGLIIILLLLNLVGLLALVVGLFFTIPMTGIAMVLLYKKWSGHASTHEGRHIASE